MNPISSFIAPPRSLIAQLLWVLIVCTLATLFAWPWRNFLDPANTAMLYVLAVAIVAARVGRGAAIASALLSSALLNFFFIHPRFTFTIGDMQHAITLAVMLTVALIIGNLTLGLRQKEEAALKRERQARALYQLASQLAGAVTPEQVDELTRCFLQEAEACDSRMFLRQGDELSPIGQAPTLRDKPYYAAHSTLTQAVVQATQDGPEQWLFLPLRGSTHTRGVLALSASDGKLLDKERLPLFEAIAALLATSVERLHFVEIAQRTQLQITNERLRSSILSALSHDIRTPLTVLYGLADKLAQADMSPDMREMAAAMHQQTLRLNGMASNLLEMARLRAGEIRLNLEWQPLEEVIGASIKLLGPALAQHPVSVKLPPNMPLLHFDAVLIERVLCNLLENAAKYAPPGSPIRIGATTDEALTHISVCNDGSQFPANRLDESFELFWRGNAESNIPGTGLGLAICKAIVLAHGGAIHACNDDGACVIFSIPLGEPPAIAPENAHE